MDLVIVLNKIVTVLVPPMLLLIYLSCIVLYFFSSVFLFFSVFLGGFYSFLSYSDFFLLCLGFSWDVLVFLNLSCIFHDFILFFLGFLSISASICTL